MASALSMVSVSEMTAIFQSPLLKGIGGFVESITVERTSDGPVYTIVTQEPTQLRKKKI